MKILHVNKFYPEDAERAGGVGVYLVDLVETQRKAGNEVHVFATNHPGVQNSADRPYYPRSIDLSKPRALDAGRFIYNREAKRRFEQMLDATEPDIIHLHNIYHHLSSSILDVISERNIPAVMTVHDFKLICPNYKLFTEGEICRRCKVHRYYQPVLHHCLTPGIGGNALAAIESTLTAVRKSYDRAVRYYLAPSRFVADELISWGLPGNKIQTIPLGFSVPTNFQDNFSAASREGIIVVARFSAEKGIEPFLEAAKDITEIPISLIGDGPLKLRIERQIIREKLTHVRLLGHLTRQETLEAIRRARFLVVPSVGFETFGLVALEAMALGTPVIAARRGGLEELITHDRGFLYEPKRPHELSDLVRLLIRHPRTLDPIVSQAKLFARTLSFENHIRALEAVYIGLL